MTENGWDTPQYAKRFERMFKVTYAEFGELTQRISARRAEQEARDRQGADGWWSRVTRARAPARKPGRKGLSVELGLAMTLRYLAGGSLWDIMLWANILSTRSFYKHVRATLVDLDACLPEPTLEADLSDPERLKALAHGFEARSYGWIKGCIGAVDGLLLPIIAPTNVEGDGAGKYFTRKGFFAWNVQGVCDSDCRITYFSMDNVGSTHDSLAWSRDAMSKRMSLGGDAFDALAPLGLHLVGDEAYTAGATMATPWSGRSCTGDSRTARLAYNYYHSAARITIERTFGQLTKRFLLLKRPYGGKDVHTAYAPGLLLILRVCVKLVRLKRLEPGSLRRERIDFSPIGISALQQSETTQHATHLTPGCPPRSIMPRWTAAPTRNGPAPRACTSPTPPRTLLTSTARRAPPGPTTRVRSRR